MAAEAYRKKAAEKREAAGNRMKGLVESAKKSLDAVTDAIKKVDVKWAFDQVVDVPAKMAE